MEQEQCEHFTGEEHEMIRPAYAGGNKTIPPSCRAGTNLREVDQKTITDFCRGEFRKCKIHQSWPE